MEVLRLPPSSGGEGASMVPQGQATTTPDAPSATTSLALHDADNPAPHNSPEEGHEAVDAKRVVDSVDREPAPLGNATVPSAWVQPLASLISAAREGNYGRLARITQTCSCITQIVNLAFPDGWTALHYVADMYEDAPQPTSRPPDRSTAATGKGPTSTPDVSSRSSRLASILFAAGASANVADRTGWTPLMCAVDAQKLPVVQLLLANGADVNATDARGTTALHVAARRRSEPLTLALLQAGANANSTDLHLGRTPLHAACAAGSPAVVRLLLRYGAHADQPDFVRMETPLHVAATEGNIPVITTLVQGGAWVNAPTADGDTPCAVANRHNHWHAALAIRKVHANTFRMPVVIVLRALSRGKASYPRRPWASDRAELSRCPVVLTTVPRPRGDTSMAHMERAAFPDVCHGEDESFSDTESDASYESASDVEKAVDNEALLATLLLETQKHGDTVAETLVRVATLPFGVAQRIVLYL